MAPAVYWGRENGMDDARVGGAVERAMVNALVTGGRGFLGSISRAS